MDRVWLLINLQNRGMPRRNDDVCVHFFFFCLLIVVFDNGFAFVCASLGKENKKKTCVCWLLLCMCRVYLVDWSKYFFFFCFWRDEFFCGKFPEWRVLKVWWICSVCWIKLKITKEPFFKISTVLPYIPVRSVVCT